ncbi:MAG: patatin-like phospholipase family protein, partial [Arenimonas sp.]
MSSGIALALSGGGYRAALFHAGALVRLAELGVLSQITRVSAISGGAIIAGIWLDELRIHPNDSQLERAKQIQTRVMQMCTHKMDVGTVIGGVLNPFQSVNDTLIKAYRKHLCPNDAPLSVFPRTPYFTFCSTNLQTGRQVYLDYNGISDYRVGTHPHRATLCEAIAASSAFPPLLAPMDLD